MTITDYIATVRPIAESLVFNNISAARFSVVGIDEQFDFHRVNDHTFKLRIINVEEWETMEV